ncbi:MAG: aminomethyltransferase family protein [Chlamydiia bacterium]|nr:aminomethyltransferase family protein [Chlamydiia bacterium]
MKGVLHDRHIALGGVMGWAFGGLYPSRYLRGVASEHNATLYRVGILDVSFMGLIEFKGPGAEPLLEYLSTNLISNSPNFSSIYTIWSNDWGGCIDDLTILRFDTHHFLAIVNGPNLLNDLEHAQRVGRFFNVDIRDRSRDLAVCAIQGPDACRVIEQIVGDLSGLKPFHICERPFKDSTLYLHRTCYGGPNGIEVIVPLSHLAELWDILMEAGEQYAIEAVGLDARNILRLEAGFARYGHELTPEIAATESVASWTVKWMKGDFIGKEALARLENDPKKRSQRGFLIKSDFLVRSGSPIYIKDRWIGSVTTSDFSQCLQKPIALGMVNVPLAIGEQIEIESRNRRVRAEVSPLPFFRL